jgi:hypothetical protein
MDNGIDWSKEDFDLEPKSETMNIIVEKRRDDYMAYIEGRREIYGCGSNPQAAIGYLIMWHKEHFNISITER